MFFHKLAVMKFLFNLLVTFFCVESCASLSSPNGYFVQTFYQYGGCSSDIQEIFAVAFDTCVPGDLRKGAFRNEFTIFTMLNESYVDSILYSDSACQDYLRNDYRISLDTCTTSGDAIFYSYSEVLPNSTLDNVAAEYVVYDTNDVSNCDHGSDVTIAFSQYAAGCLGNCLYEHTWQHCSFSCDENDTLLMTYSNESTCDYEIGHWSAPSSPSCREQFTCFNVTQREESSENDGGDDDDGLSAQDQVVVIVVTCVVLMAVAVAVAAHMLYIRPPKSPDLMDLQEPLTAQQK